MQADAFFSTNGPEAIVNKDASDSYSRGVDANIAVAVTDHFALTASLSHRWERNVYEDYTILLIDNYKGTDTRYYRMNWEIGCGYYGSIHQRGKLWLQILGGIGGGRYAIDDFGYVGATSGSLALRYQDANVFKAYINPAVHLYLNDVLTMAIGARIVGVNYSGIRTDYSQYEQQSLLLDNLNNNTLFAFQPCADLKFTIPKANWISLHMQFGFSSPFKNYNSRKFNASFGLTFSKTGKRKGG